MNLIFIRKNSFHALFTISLNNIPAVTKQIWHLLILQKEFHFYCCFNGLIKNRFQIYFFLICRVRHPLHKKSFEVRYLCWVLHHEKKWFSKSSSKIKSAFGIAFCLMLWHANELSGVQEVSGHHTRMYGLISELPSVEPGGSLWVLSNSGFILRVYDFIILWLTAFLWQSTKISSSFHILWSGFLKSWLPLTIPWLKSKALSQKELEQQGWLRRDPVWVDYSDGLLGRIEVLV